MASIGTGLTVGLSPHSTTIINSSSMPVTIATDTNGCIKVSGYPEWNGDRVIFGSGDKILFIIMPDGRISKGEAFTTLDEMSIAFWDKVAENFPVAWWKSLCKRDQQPK